MYHAAFEYLYRDASNYKAWGGVILMGDFMPIVLEKIRNRFESETLFIAKQIGMPDLRAELWRWSGGCPNDDDHEWHELWDVRGATNADIQKFPIWGTAEEFLKRLSAVEEWKA